MADQRGQKHTCVLVPPVLLPAVTVVAARRVHLFSKSAAACGLLAAVVLLLLLLPGGLRWRSSIKCGRCAAVATADCLSGRLICIRQTASDLGTNSRR